MMLSCRMRSLWVVLVECLATRASALCGTGTAYGAGSSALHATSDVPYGTFQGSIMLGCELWHLSMKGMYSQR